MEISIPVIVDLSIQLSLYAFISMVLGTVIVAIDQTLTKGKFNLRQAGLITKVGMTCTLLGVLGFTIAFMGFIFAGVGWLWNYVFEQMSPKRLALYSLIIGPTPFIFPLLAKLICKLTGGSVDASQVSGCVFMGLNLNGLVYTLFMSYWLVLLTGGIATFGLMSSGIWALVKLF